MKLVNNIKLLLLSILILIVMVGCFKYPDLGIRERDLDITVTLYDVNANFRSYLTFDIIDTILVLREENGDEEIDTLSQEFTKLIKNNLRSFMLERGYEELTTDTSDLFLDVTVLDATNYGTIVTGGCGYYPGWGGWGGYYPGWGGYYPGWGWCYPFVVSDSYYNRLGTVVIQMADLTNADKVNQVVPILWIASLRGFLSENAVGDASRLNQGMMEAFVQSPYIRR